MGLRKALLFRGNIPVWFSGLCPVVSLLPPPFIPSSGDSQCPSTCHTGRAQEVELDLVNSLLVSNSGKNNTT